MSNSNLYARMQRTIEAQDKEIKLLRAWLVACAFIILGFIIVFSGLQ